MKINEELSILFWLKRTKTTKDGRVPIYVRITVNGDRDNFSSGKKIHPDHWDEENATADKACADHQFINSYVTKTKAELERCYNQVAALHKKVKAIMVKEAYMPTNSAIQQTLNAAFVLHNKEFADRVHENKASPGTLARYHRLQTKCIAFVKLKYKVNDLALNEVQMALAVNFYHHLIMQKIGENAAMKYIKTLKQVIDRAIKEGWIQYNPITQFKCTYEEPEREYLEIEEIMAIYHKEITVERLVEIRDVFVFCCFTGYAYETCYKLQADNIFTGVDGKLWISKDRQKTGAMETVPLMPIALEIIKKYKTHPCRMEEGRLLPVNSNYRYNVYLKELANICGIKKRLTTHTARHTFATTVTLENDVPIETVGKMLGHKDLRSTQVYAKITRRKISNNMKQLEGKLFNENGQLKTG
jgi:site-specific recombinase XerD